MENDFQKIIFEELIDFFTPIIDIGGNEEAIEELFQDVGWDIKALLNDNQSGLLIVTSSAIEALQIVRDFSNVPPQSLIELMQALVEIAPAFDALQKLADPGAMISLPDNPRVNELPEDLAHYLLAKYLANKSQTLFRFLQLVGILGIKKGKPLIINNKLVHKPHNAVHFYFESFGDFLINQKDHFKSLYWPNDFPDIDETNKVAHRLFPRIAALLETLNVHSFIGRGAGANEFPENIEKKLEGLMSVCYNFYDTESSAFLNATASLGLLPETEEGPGFFVVPSGKLSANISLEDWVLSFLASGRIDGFSITESGLNIYSAGGHLRTFNFELNLSKKNKTGEKVLLIGGVDSTRVEIGEISYGAKIALNSSRNEFLVYTVLKDCALIIAAGSGDNFLSVVIGGNEINLSSSLKFGISNIAGFYIEGSGGLEISLPLHIQLGPIEIQRLTIAVKPEDGNIPIEISSTIRAELGPLQVVVENIGLSSTISFPPAGNGNLGPIDFNLGFKPPNGLGLSINAGAVIGGGYLFFDFDKQEYAGALELTIAGFISAKAIGIITTKMPDGSKGFSMLIIITAEFFPPFQIGYGFTLNGLGGLLGLNRTVLQEPLTNAVSTGAIDGIMFPTNVVANAPRIISDLKTIFPPLEGSFLVGPMAKIGWGTPSIITLSLGVIVQLPDPVIAILGILKMVLPTEDAALLKLQVNFAGLIDPANKLITFNASLFDSHLMHAMTLTGNMAVRLKWGDKPDFILAAGGFHPDYSPAMHIGSMERIGIKILDRNNARIRVQAYFAVTPNTVQFGARADCYFGLDGFSVSGDLGFDAIMQFSPFTFRATASGNFTLKAGPGDASIRIRGILKGPAPWYVKATGTLEVFGGEWEVPFEDSWGDSNDDTLPRIAIKEAFLNELKKDECWHTELPAGRMQLVTAINPKVEIESADNQLPIPLKIHPFGSLVISQKFLPLDLSLDKLGNQKVSDYHKVNIFSITIGKTTATKTDISDLFAVAQYKDMSDSQKVSRPSFEKFTSGAKATFGANNLDFKMGKAIRREHDYEQIIVDRSSNKQKNKIVLHERLFRDLLSGSAINKSQLSHKYKSYLGINKTKLPTSTTGYTIVDVYTNQPLNPAANWSSRTMAVDSLRHLTDGNEALYGQIFITETI